MAYISDINALKRIALERYEQDSGTMCECFDTLDLARAIDEAGGVEQAWAQHLRDCGAVKETQACYDLEGN